MGIELVAPKTFNARCDGCDVYAEIKAIAVCTAQLKLRELGWSRRGYIETAHHYMWWCPKCKDLQ